MQSPVADPLNFSSPTNPFSSHESPLISGGNGLAAIQLANSVFKAKVYAICDTEDTSALIRDEGAYKSISIMEGPSAVYKFLAKSFTDKKAKVVYDAAGGGLMHLVADL